MQLCFCKGTTLLPPALLCFCTQSFLSLQPISLSMHSPIFPLPCLCLTWPHGLPLGPPALPQLLWPVCTWCCLSSPLLALPFPFCSPAPLALLVSVLHALIPPSSLPSPPFQFVFSLPCPPPFLSPSNRCSRLGLHCLHFTLSIPVFCPPFPPLPAPPLHPPEPHHCPASALLPYLQVRPPGFPCPERAPR